MLLGDDAMLKIAPYALFVIALALFVVGCAALQEKADEAAQTVVDHESQITQGTEFAAEVLPPPFDWIALAGGNLLLLAATSWLSYRQGKKKAAPAS